MESKDLFKQVKKVVLVVAVIDTNSNDLSLLVVSKPEEYDSQMILALLRRDTDMDRFRRMVAFTLLSASGMELRPL